MADNYFVKDPLQWHVAFQSWHGTLGRWLKARTEEVRTEAMFEVPSPMNMPNNRTGRNYSTGRLAESIETSYGFTPSGELESRVTANTEYAIYVHEGTAPHTIRPKKSDELVFYWPSAGKQVFAEVVEHPGTKSNPFLREGLEYVFNFYLT